MPASVNGRRRSPQNMSPVLRDQPPAPPSGEASIVSQAAKPCAVTMALFGSRSSGRQASPPSENTCPCSEPGAPTAWTRSGSPGYAVRIGVAGSPWARDENIDASSALGALR